MGLTLSKNAFHGKRTGPVVVVVMDGVGLGPDDAGNAVKAARKPTLDQLMATCPWTRVGGARHGGGHAQRRRHGQQRGRPQRARRRPRLRPGREARRPRPSPSGALFEGEAWKELVAQRACARAATLHFIGLLSDGNVHCHIDHLKAHARARRQKAVRRSCACTCCSTAATCRETSALDYVDALEALLARAQRERPRLPHRLGRRPHGHHHGPLRGRLGDGRARLADPRARRGPALRVSAREAIETLRAEQPGRHRSGPAALRDRGDDGKPVGPIGDGDSVVLFNFRGDRAIEITRPSRTTRSTSSTAGDGPTCSTPA